MPDQEVKTFGLPIIDMEETAYGKRYIVDLTDTVTVSFVQKDDQAQPLELQILFTAAKVKVPASDPRPVADSKGKVVLEMVTETNAAQNNYKAFVKIKEKTTLDLFLTNSLGDEISKGEFALTVPINEATFEPEQNT